MVMSRVAGIALIALGMACWPGHDVGRSLSRALLAMLCYSLLVTLYLANLGIGGERVWTGLVPPYAIGSVTMLWFIQRVAAF